METYEKRNIQEMPLRTPYFRRQVENFLQANGLRMEALDSYFTLQNEDGRILAGAGLYKDILKCVAVGADVRSEGLMVPLVSHVLSVAASRGVNCLKVFTKPEHQAVFESLGFRLLAAAPEAILLENGRGLEQYCAYLRTFRRPGKSGVVVMNANPFTLGHQYLVEQAAAQVDTLFIIPVREDLSLFPYTERLAMLRAGVGLHASAGLTSIMPGIDRASQVVVLEGSAYQISAATFPTYFLKDLTTAAETQMRLDLDLFARHIAPALDASVRFVGSEPLDPLTARYNDLMKELLPQVVEIPRLNSASHAISASAVRKALEEGQFALAVALTPSVTHPYLLAEMAKLVLRMELDTPCKPGLVGPDSNGAHKDMDYACMLRGILAIRPFWPRIALAESAEELISAGIAAEKAMLEATGGVNTHRGAIFCLGLALNAWRQGAHTEVLMQNALGEIAQSIFSKSQIVNNLPPRGAMAIALEGYRPLFEDWLPFYRQHKDLHLLLLRIISTLDDTCVIKRAGYERAQEVKQEAAQMADQLGHDVNAHVDHDASAHVGHDANAQVGHAVMPGLTGHLKEMCERYAAEGISPGGAADMLSLTILIDMLLQ